MIHLSLLVPLCGVGDLSCLAKEAASTVFTTLVRALGDGVLVMVKFLSTFWMSVPSPSLATGGGQSWTVSQTITQMNLWLAPVTALVAACSFAVQLVRIGYRTSIAEAGKLGRLLVAVMAAPVCAVVITELLVMAGDAFSPWIIDQATQGGASDGLVNLMKPGLKTVDTAAGQAGMWFLFFILDLLGALMQCIFMAMRAPILVLLMVFLGPTAAAASSDEGWLRLKRLFMLILAWTLYKPAAALIYSAGLTMMSTKGDDSVSSAVWGLVVMGMSALALPALIKFLAPAAALGSSSMASGAAAVGAIATGAALLGMGMAGGAGGAAAGAGGASAPTPTAPPSGGGGGGGQPAPPTGGTPPPSGGGGGGPHLPLVDMVSQGAKRVSSDAEQAAESAA